MEGGGGHEIQVTAARLHKQVVALRTAKLPSKLTESTKVAFIEANMSMIIDMIDIFKCLNRIPNCDLDDAISYFESDKFKNALREYFFDLTNIVSAESRSNLLEFVKSRSDLFG